MYLEYKNPKVTASSNLAEVLRIFAGRQYEYVLRVSSETQCSIWLDNKQAMIPNAG